MRGENPETQIDEAWTELQNLLEQERVRVQEEIASYPPPITACDAQFNHLLEQRTRISRALTRMADLAQIPGSEAERRDFLEKGLADLDGLPEEAATRFRFFLEGGRPQQLTESRETGTLF